ncbi:MAG: GspH/FimT family pseudopilin, partial [Nitrospirota bacterium]
WAGPWHNLDKGNNSGRIDALMLTQTLKDMTLRNLFAVLAIVGLESAAALPHISSTLKDYRLNSATTEVWLDMHRAQFMAIKEKRTIRVDFDQDSYRITRVTTGEVTLTRHLTREYPEISLVVSGGREGIVFDRTGATEGDSREIEITGPAGKKSFTILATGVIGNLP